MVFSTKYSYFVLRVGLAIVFFWLGITTFFHPAPIFHLASSQIIYVSGIFEVLIGLSLVTGVFSKFFSLIGIVFLVGTIRDAGLIGGLLAVFLWPDHGNQR